MKKVAFLIIGLAVFASLSGQQFQTKESGNITDMSIFLQKVSNSNKWIDAVCAPYGYVTVNKNDTVIINEAYVLDSICVKAGGVLIINAPLNLLIPIIVKGTAVIGGDTNLVQLPLTTLIDDVIPNEMFNAYCRNGLLKVNVRTYGDLKVVDVWGRIIFTSEIQGEGYHEFNPRMGRGMYAAIFTSGNLRLVKKFIYM